MSNSSHISPYIANDNAPNSIVPRGDAVGFNASLQDRKRERFQRENPPAAPKHINGLWMSVLVWAAFAAGLAWSFYTSQSVGIRIFCAIGMIWTGLWTRFLALDHEKPRLAEISLLSTLIAFVSLMLTAATQLGFPLSLPAAMCLFVFASLVVSWLNHSQMALIAAIGAGLVWAALHLDGFISSGIYAMAIPALWSGMILQSIKLKSAIGIMTSLIVSYIWLFGGALQSYDSGSLNGVFLAGSAIVIGALHYKAAKAAEDEGHSGTMLHVTIGWVIANTALLALAYFGLDPDQAGWITNNPVDPLARLVWGAVMVCAAGIFFMTGLVRRRHKRMSMAGVCLTTLVTLCVPLAIWQEPALAAFVEANAGVSFYPAIGLFLFGILTGNILLFMTNGFRRSNYIQVITAMTLAVGVAVSLINFDLGTDDRWLIWLMGSTLSGIVALIAVEPQLNPKIAPEDRKSVSSS